MKTMLVTGASSGIGRALAVRAARAGYAVYAVGRNRDALEALRVKIESEGGFVEVDATDIALAANARALVKRALARFGSIDVLVNNAGFVSVGALSAQSDEELQRQFGTHVLGPVALVREALDALRAVRGHVFMLGSGVARVPVGELGAYPPAKAAIRSASAILRRELAPQGIAVTYVDPGAVDTPFMTRAGMPGAPARILVSPEAVARKILIAVADRPRVLNAVAWQTAAVALAEFFPRLTDLLLERAPSLIGGGNEQGVNALDGSPSRGDSLLGDEPQADLPEAASAPNTDREGLPSDIVSLDKSSENEPETAPPEASVTASPTGQLAEPSSEHRDPISEPTDANSEPTEPTAEPTESIAEYRDLISEPTEHISEPIDQISQPTEPIAEPTEPISEPIDPISEPTEPISVSTEPISEPEAHSFEGALKPHRRRMEKLNFRESFVRELLVVDARLELGDIALRWAGMPNKNERAITHEVLESLAQAGFLERSDGGTYRVLRAP